jgi:uncharacterized repeat protein (TIGR01451 family)
MMQKSRRRLLVGSLPVVMAAGLSASIAAPAYAQTGSSLTITESHQQAFVAGGTGTYTLTVGNSGSSATDAGAIKVTGTLPAGMTALAVGGSGWNCTTSPSLSCTRSDALGPRQAYMPITLTVGISPSLAGKTVAGSFRVTKAKSGTRQDQASVAATVTVTNNNNNNNNNNQSQSQTVNVKCPSDKNNRSTVHTKRRH